MSPAGLGLALAATLSCCQGNESELARWVDAPPERGQQLEMQGAEMRRLRAVAAG